jgi:hypothetical protein
MTRHYSHVSELAAARAVALLPSGILNNKPEPPKRDAEAILLQVATIAKQMKVTTWRAKRDEMIALIAAANAVMPQR